MLFYPIRWICDLTIMEFCKICRKEIINIKTSNDDIKKIIGGLAHKNCINEFSEHEKIKLLYNESDYIYLDFIKLLNHEIEDLRYKDEAKNANEINFIDYKLVEDFPC